MNENQAIEESKKLLKELQFFSAYDFTKKALKEFPDSIPLKQLCAKAMIRVEAFREAINILKPLCNANHPDNDSYQETFFPPPIAAPRRA